MRQLNLRVQAIRRSTGGLPDDGAHLADLVRQAVARRSAAPVAVVIRPERTDLLALGPIVEMGLAVRPFIAGLTASGGTSPGGDGPPLGAALAVGIAGQFRWRATRGDSPVPVALTFLEGPDCSWWQWQALLDAEGAVRPETVLQRCSADGDPMPSGLGRWWSHARRTGARVRFGPAVVPTVPALESPLVH